MSYDAFAETFSNSRKNLHWPELEYIIADMKSQNYSSILDIGCGNGRFLEESQKLDFTPWIYLGIDSSEWMITEARKLHSGNHFEAIGMQELRNTSKFQILSSKFDCILFLASFHHLEIEVDRIQVLQDAKKLLSPNGRIYMTNWNLLEQEKYQKNHRWNGEFDIKIGKFSRYYYGFTQVELEKLCIQSGYTIIENRIFEWGRNILSILEKA
jgi:2-polyprenyl-3-methyl-5-hydroxy-6-metoxy-1,4-benzoquinol methylase